MFVAREKKAVYVECKIFHLKTKIFILLQGGPKKSL